jgi:hypothetical protein
VEYQDQSAVHVSMAFPRDAMVRKTVNTVRHTIQLIMNLIPHIFASKQGPYSSLLIRWWPESTFV